MNVSFTATSSNRKTGNVPTAWVGANRAERRASCSGCPLLDAGCYAHSGPVALAANSVQRAIATGADRSIDAALANRAHSARMFRLTAIGDIGRAPAALAATIKRKIKAAGLAIVGYTHHWREADVSASWRGVLMASTETLADADTAIDSGWRATTIVAADAPARTTTPAGRPVIVCPAQQAEARGVTLTCNDCRRCDGSRHDSAIIAFRAHGNQAKEATQQAQA